MSAAAIAALSTQEADAIRQRLRDANLWQALKAFNTARINGLVGRLVQAHR